MASQRALIVSTPSLTFNPLPCTTTKIHIAAKNMKCTPFYNLTTIRLQYVRYTFAGMDMDFQK